MCTYDSILNNSSWPSPGFQLFTKVAKVSAADPHPDPDPACHFDVDPDPTFLFHPDPGRDPSF
jgi:hypothetical protein